VNALGAVSQRAMVIQNFHASGGGDLWSVAGTLVTILRTAPLR
jgi:hypothetical protein